MFTCSAIATLGCVHRQSKLTKVAVGILLTTLGVGALMGWMGLLWSQGGFTPGGAVHLTQEQAEALQWAISAEGKFARNLMKWNSDSLSNLEYKKEVRRLGVTLEVIGRAATSGFCNIIGVSPIFEIFLEESINGTQNIK